MARGPIQPEVRGAGRAASGVRGAVASGGVEGDVVVARLADEVVRPAGAAVEDRRPLGDVVDAGSTQPTGRPWWSRT